MKIKILSLLISSFMLADLSATNPTSIDFLITNENVDYQRLPMSLGSIYFQNNFGKDPNTFLSAIPKNPGESETVSQSMSLSTWNNITFILFVIGNPDLSSNAVNCSGVLPYDLLPKQVNVTVSQHSSGKSLLTPMGLSCQVSFASDK